MGFSDNLLQILADNGVTLSETQKEQFAKYFALLVSWNEKMNLTAITDEQQVYLKHFYDSLTLAFHVDLSTVKTIADIGSGAGFPSFPLKIAFPHLKLTIVESLNKRITFLNEVCRELTLDDVSFFHGRAEDLGRDARLRDTFDLVTARAVARLHTLSELCLPFVKVNGTFVAMKGTQAEEEIIEAKGAWRELNGKCVASHQLALPEEDSSRSIIVIQKTAATPKKYPRKAGIPNKQPLL